MAGIWCSLCHRRKNGDCYQSHPYVVHVYFFANIGISNHNLYDTCVLDEYEKVYSFCKKKSAEVFVMVGPLQPFFYSIIFYEIVGIIFYQYKYSFVIQFKTIRLIPSTFSPQDPPLLLYCTY